MEFSWASDSVGLGTEVERTLPDIEACNSPACMN